MKVNRIAPINFQAGVKINSEENKSCQYLYNKLLGITNEFKIPATFRTHEIDLPTVSDKILARLKDLGIKFS